MTQALANALMMFAKAMLLRLMKKHNEGFTRWDSLPRSDLIAEIKKKTHLYYNEAWEGHGMSGDPKHLVDIANYAMFLWARHFK